MCLALGHVDVGTPQHVLEALGQAEIGCEIRNTAKKNSNCNEEEWPFLGEGQKRRVTG